MKKTDGARHALALRKALALANHHGAVDVDMTSNMTGIVMFQRACWSP